MSELTLTFEEQAMLDGAEGPGVKRAMEIVVALARIYGAADLIPVVHAQIAGVSYKNLGDAGVQFLSEWADEGARVRVPTTLNPMGMERGKWQQWGISTDFAVPQLSVIDAFAKMGVTPTMSCTPYLFREHTPMRGDALAWAESSAVAFANSVIGARSNREGGPSAIAAAVVGRTGRYGYHLDENRRANFVVEVRCPVKSVADFGALSYSVGKAVGSGVPWFADLDARLAPLSCQRGGPAFSGRGGGLGGPAGDRLKTLGAGLAAYGAVALYHVAGVTPEARDLGEALIRPDAKRLVIEDLDDAYRVMDADPDLKQIDLVTVGCPHASLTEIAQVAEYLAGKTLATRLWVTTGRDHPPGRGRAGLRADHRGGRRRGRGRHLRGRRADADAGRAQHGDQRRQDGLLRADAQRGADAVRGSGGVSGCGGDGGVAGVAVKAAGTWKPTPWPRPYLHEARHHEPGQNKEVYRGVGDHADLCRVGGHLQHGDTSLGGARRGWSCRIHLHLRQTYTLPVQRIGDLGSAHHPPLYYLIASIISAPADVNDPTGAFQANPDFIWAGQGGSDVNVALHASAETFPHHGQALMMHLARLASVLMGLITVALVIAIGMADLRGIPAGSDCWRALSLCSCRSFSSSAGQSTTTICW